MPPKGKKKQSGPPGPPLDSETKQYIQDNIRRKPCLRCLENHDSYECPMKPCLTLHGWYGTKDPRTKRLIDAYMRKLQAERPADESASQTPTPITTPSSVPPAAPITTPVAAPVAATTSNLASSTRMIWQGSIGDGATAASQGTEPHKEEDRSSYELINLEPTAQRMPPAQNVPPIDLGGGSKYTLPDDLDRKLELLRGQTNDFPVRRKFRSESTEVLTNHFEIEIPKNTGFYEYQILGIPTGTNRRMSKMFVDTAIRHSFLNNQRNSFASDGIKTIVSWLQLTDLSQATSSTGDEWTLCKVKDGEIDVELKLKFIRNVDVQSLQNYVASTAQHKHWNTNDVVNALNIVISKYFDGNVIKLGSNKFFVEHGYKNLGSSLYAIRGYFYTIKPGLGRILLNVNSATSAFFRPIPLSRLLTDPDFEQELPGILHGLRVRIGYNRGTTPDSPLDKDEARIKRIYELGDKSVAEQTFTKTNKDKDGNITSQKTVTVQKYLQDTYKLNISQPDLKAVNLGSRKNKSWFPPEHLHIMPYQIYRRVLPSSLTASIQSIANKMPVENRQHIGGEGLSFLTLDNQSPLQIIRDMLRLPSYRLDYPRIQYWGPQFAIPAANTARWSLENRKFFKSGKKTDEKIPLRYSILYSSHLRWVNQSFYSYRGEFEKQMISCGVARPELHDDFQLDRVNYETLRKSLEYYAEHDKHPPELIILLIPSRDQVVYSDFKYLAERVYGFQTIVVTENANVRVEKTDKNDNEGKKPKPKKYFNHAGVPQYMGNVMMKANLKRGGINHTVKQLETVLRNGLILGADVTHPGPGALFGCPSIAAMVGSVDPTGGKFLGSLRLQTGRMEMIEHMRELVAERLYDWATHNGELPKYIVYYRDGVSESQYEQIKRGELAEIPKAWNDTVQRIQKEQGRESKTQNYKLIAIVVTKRHHTRFYPTDPKYTMDKNKNCLPGTVVDQGVTSPYWDDFYLQSHNSIKGTAKPAHYFVLQNDLGISAAELQNLTHNLCYTYVRATLGVSYASPAYYADRLCERGRCYLREFFSPSKTTRDEFFHNKKTYEEKREATHGAKSKRDPKVKRPKEEVEKERVEARADREWVNQQMEEYVDQKVKRKWTAPDIYNPGEENGRRLQKRKEEILKTMYWM